MMSAGDCSSDGEAQSPIGITPMSSNLAVGDGSGCSLPSQYGSGNCPVSSNSILARPTSLLLPSLTSREPNQVLSVDGDHKSSHEAYVTLPYSTAVLTPITPTWTSPSSSCSTFVNSLSENCPQSSIDYSSCKLVHSVNQIKITDCSPVASNVSGTDTSIFFSNAQVCDFGSSTISPNILSPSTPSNNLTGCVTTYAPSSMLISPLISGNLQNAPLNQRSMSQPNLSRATNDNSCNPIYTFCFDNDNDVSKKLNEQICKFYTSDIDFVAPSYAVAVFNFFGAVVVFFVFCVLIAIILLLFET
mgnify:CR=1 FL=1